MKKYLVNRVLRSIFSVFMVMLLSVVLIFSLIPQSEIYTQDEKYKSSLQVGRTDDAELAKLDALERHGYIQYVSQADYCESLFPDTAGARYQVCVARLDSNEDKKNYVEKYRALGWEEVRLTQSKYGNCDIVTRKDVEAGDYVVQEGQYFIEMTEGVQDPNDELYEDYIDENGSKKFREVTFNNRTYFKKNLNPLVTFWNWLTGIISFDNKNKVENLTQWSYEEQRYLYEDRVYSLVFEYEKSTGIESTNYIYQYNGGDIDLLESEISIYNSETNSSKDFISIAGISTGIEIGAKNIKEFSIVKNYNDENDLDKGGSMDINITFDDNTTLSLNKKVAKYLLDSIPVYVGDNDMWFVGNTSINIAYTKIEKDWGMGNDLITFYNEIVNAELREKEIERGYSVKLDEYGTPALTCVGCEYKYSIYFDTTFPYIHFNFIKINLGESILGTTQGRDVVNIMTDNQGEAIYTTNTDLSGEQYDASYDYHTCSYNSNDLGTDQKKRFNDNYTNCDQVLTSPSKIATSFIIGIFATLIAYFIGVPIGVVMARNKEKWIDKLGMVYIIIMFAVPSLAYIYFVKSIGHSLFKLPGIFEYGNIGTYILPIISLSLGSIASMMMWTRRYIIDQENSDYVKFARAKGLSESQIFFKHILRNAIVPIAHGIPGSLIGAVAGAMITEKIYNVPGTGGLMVESINGYNNWAAIGLIFFFTVLGIISLILGDVVITLVDPRISFTDTGGRK